MGIRFAWGRIRLHWPGRDYRTRRQDRCALCVPRFDAIMTESSALAGARSDRAPRAFLNFSKEQKMSTIPNTVAIPADDPRRNLVVANPDDSGAQHHGVV